MASNEPADVRPAAGTPSPAAGSSTTFVLAGGCFWCLDAVYRITRGVRSVVSGYTGGAVEDPSYHAVCTGRTGHAEVVQVVFDPTKLSYRDLLKVFWEAHDPTQGYRQGNDVGTQYRSAVFTTTPEQAEAAAATRALYEPELRRNGYGEITTEVRPVDGEGGAGTFYYAEDYHQQYLHKVPNGYCPVHSTGVSCPVGLPGV